MAQKLFFVAVAAILACAAVEARAGGCCGPYDYGMGPGYYLPTGCPCDVGASLYPCPRPVPPWVGVTYIPYAPLAPAEFLEPHHQCYVTCDPCTGARTRTSVTYNHRCLKGSLKPSMMWALPRADHPTGGVPCP